MAGAALTRGRRLLAAATSAGVAGAPYRPALLALREGPLLEAAVRALPSRPDVLLVNATGRDHPRRAGLALHLGAVLGLPTVGVTDRPLLAEGRWPPDAASAAAPLLLDGEPVGCWLRTRPGVRPVAVHAAWRTGVEAAVRWCRRRPDGPPERRSRCGGPAPPPESPARPRARQAEAGPLSPSTRCRRGNPDSSR